MTNVTIPAQVLKTAASFVTRDERRPAMTNVQVWNRPGLGLHVTATDAHVLYSWKSAPLPFEFQFLIEGLRPKEKREDFRFQIEPGGLPVAESGGILNHGQAVAAADSTKKPYKTLQTLTKSLAMITPSKTTSTSSKTQINAIPPTKKPSASNTKDKCSSS